MSASSADWLPVCAGGSEGWTIFICCEKRHVESLVSGFCPCPCPCPCRCRSHIPFPAPDPTTGVKLSSCSSAAQKHKLKRREGGKPFPYSVISGVDRDETAQVEILALPANRTFAERGNFFFFFPQTCHECKVTFCWQCRRGNVNDAEKHEILCVSTSVQFSWFSFISKLIISTETTRICPGFCVKATFPTGSTVEYCFVQDATRCHCYILRNLWAKLDPSHWKLGHPSHTHWRIC